MTRALFAGVVLCCTALTRGGPPTAETLADAEAHFLAGFHERAVAVYRARAADSQTRIAAHVGWTHVDLATGRYREAIERLRSVSTEGESNSDWHAALADALAEVGEYDDALAHGRRALALAADNVHARYRLARLLERLGRRDEAVALYEWFDKLLHDHLPERADELTDAGRGFYRYSVLTRHENLKDRCRYVLQEVYQEAYEFVDSRYWPARLAAAELMLEKHNLNEATSDLRRVLQANGKATGAYVGLAAAALENWNFDEAEKQANKALEVNPRCAAALLALGRTRMLERRYEQAEKVARQMLATNPRDIEGLALLAAAQLRSDQPEAAAATAKRLEAFAPHSAALHFELGYWLSAGRQYADSERELRAAIAADPTWPEPRTELGLLLMQSGDERGARRELEAAWQLDSFNHQTFNVLGLLDELEKFATYDAGPFTLRYDPAEDSAALPFMARRLKGIYSDVTKLFGFEPTQKTTIEIFPQHSRFSVRITGRPWIHTVGACTGPIIAIDAPREGASIAPYNWASTLRHEFSHTVTLGATGNRIPHWMTEGMAVWAEQNPRPWSWKLLLSQSMRRGELFTLKTIDWGFMRPRRPTDRNLAYAQAEWQIEFIVERKGRAAVLALLKAFRERQTQAQAIRAVVGLSPAEFDEQFASWARQQAAGWGLPLDPLPDRRVATAQALLRPDDADLLAKLALLALFDGEVQQCRAKLDRALESQPDHVPALRLWCLLAVEQAEHEAEDAARVRKLEEAESAIRRLAKLAPTDADALRCAAILDQSQKHWDEAIAGWQAYLKIRPDDPDAFRRLSGIYLVTERFDDALAPLETLCRLAEDDAEVRRELARLYQKRGDSVRAAEWFNHALDVDPYDADTHRELGELALKAGDLTQAEVHFKTLVELPATRREGHERLAAVYRKMGRSADAEKHAAAAREQ